MTRDVEITDDRDVTINNPSAPAGDVAVVADYEVEVIQEAEQGPPGPVGPAGPSGPPGPLGPQGPAGLDGNTILYGTVNPTASVGNTGDFYINTTTHFYFGPKSAGSWPAGTSLIGPTGAQGNQGPQGIQGVQGNPGVDGNTVLYGAADPTGAQGVDGNFYINTTTHFMFGPKAGGIWPAGVSLVGPQGPQGIQGIQGIQGTQGVPGPRGSLWYERVGPPGVIAGVQAEDNYLDTTTGDVYSYYAGAWGSPVGNIRGPQGIQGNQGIQGPPGPVPEAPTDGQIYGRQSTAWTPVAVTGVVRYDSAQALASAQQLQARQNIYAAPFDAMAFSGMQVNGNFDVAQELGATIVSIFNGGRNLADVYSVNIGHPTAQLTAQQQPMSAGYAYNNMLRHSCGVAMSLAVGDYTQVAHQIEGSRVARLRWGQGAAAQPITVCFWVMCDVMSGIGSLAVRNPPAYNRAYVADFPVTHNVWTFHAITIPGCPDGVWERGNLAGLNLVFTFGAGANYKTADTNTWLSSTSSFGSTNTSNFFATANSSVYITGLMVLPGTQAPTAAQAPLVSRPVQTELPLVQRYFRQMKWTIEGYSGGAQHRITSGWAMPAMRVPPPVTRVSILSSMNIRGGDTNQFVVCAPLTESGGTLSAESANAGYVQAVQVLDNLSARM